MIFRLIAAKWAAAKGLKPNSVEGSFDFDTLLEYNAKGYNCYYFPNYPSDAAFKALPINPETKRRRNVRGSDVDTFEWVFVDMDLKEKKWPDKTTFLEEVFAAGMMPTRIVDSGNGVHVYWRVIDLDPMSFLRINRRLCRRFKTDEAVSTLNQLMRVPNTLNVKDPDNYKIAEVVWDEPGNEYDCEALDKWLPPITPQDEAYCKHHYDSAHNPDALKINVSESLPPKFLKLARQNKELHDLFYGQSRDRSAADFRLGHLLFDLGFAKDEALNVLYCTSKAAERAPMHRYNYAANIVEKIWLAPEPEAEPAEKPKRFALSVKEMDDEDDGAGERIRCHPAIDGTKAGFRIGEVLGLIGGSGNGKTTNALNILRWFTEYNVNKDYIHLYVTLEMPVKQIKARWKKMREELKRTMPGIDWDSMVYILGNYNDDGTYRELGLDEIAEHAAILEKETGKKIGCIVCDHIGIIKQKQSKDEFSGLMGVCKGLKAFAIKTQSFFIIQSQTSRAKNMGGDVELDMDAAFGTSQFEFFADWVMTTWQPLKRVYERMEAERFLAVTAFKFAKIREKDLLEDDLKADTPYGLVFDPRTALLREMTSDEHKAFEFWSKQATTARNKDKKKEPAPLAVINWTKKE